MKCGRRKFCDYQPKLRQICSPFSFPTKMSRLRPITTNDSGIITMPSFPRAPSPFKGAIIGFDRGNPLASIIIFQYNPHTMTRQLNARAINWEDGSNRYEPYRLMGPPNETITLDVEIDAADQLETRDPIAIKLGVYPAISALEMLLYPKSLTVIKNMALERAGNIEIIPPEGAFTLFVWGKKRVLPVRLSSFSITEEAYDPQLNPIRASVNLTLQVMSYYDLERNSKGANLFMVHQVAKEVMATTNVLNSVANIGFSLPL